MVVQAPAEVLRVETRLAASPGGVNPASLSGNGIPCTHADSLVLIHGAPITTGIPGEIRGA